MKNYLLITLSLIVLLFSSCMFSGKRVEGNGKVTTQQRQVQTAKRIKVMGGMDVYLTRGATAVKVEAEENILSYIITEVDDNWLKIKMRDRINFKTHAPIKVYISTPSISGINISGSGNVILDTEMSSDKAVAIKISGSGDLTMQLNSPKVDADIAGSGNINISGETRDVQVEIAGSGNYKGGELKAENARVNIAGSGDAEVFADVRLDAKIVGSGNVAYRGNAEVNRKIVGSGGIRRMD